MPPPDQVPAAAERLGRPWVTAAAGWGLRWAGTLSRQFDNKGKEWGRRGGGVLRTVSMVMG